MSRGSLCPRQRIRPATPYSITAISTGGCTMTAEAEKKIEQAQQTVEEQRAHVSGAVGKLMLASIGAVALAQESLESLLKRMVERGEQLQEDARKRADELRKKGRQV